MGDARGLSVAIDVTCVEEGMQVKDHIKMFSILLGETLISFIPATNGISRNHCQEISKSSLTKRYQRVGVLCFELIDTSNFVCD